MIEWIKNKYMKPSYYNEKLFVSRTKNIWRKLIFNILNSDSYNEIRKSLCESNQINFFIDEEIINKIIDSIRYITYHTNDYDDTHANTLRIYEYGIFNKDIDNESISLLIYYASNIVVNIHKIGGLINIKLKHYYNKKSPKILEDKNNLNILYTTSRDQELGENIEIKLFGKVLYTLTIKEALYILNIDNYKKCVKEFKKDFCDCDSKDIAEILNNNNLQELLPKLDINIKEVIKNETNKAYPFSDDLKQKIQLNIQYLDICI